MSNRKVLECGCWRQELEPRHATTQEDAKDHLSSFGQHLHTSLCPHQLTTLFLDDLQAKLSQEVQRREVTEKDITVHRNVHSTNIIYDNEDVNLKSSKRGHCSEGDLRGVGETEEVSTAKRICTEQVVLSL